MRSRACVRANLHDAIDILFITESNKRDRHLQFIPLRIRGGVNEILPILYEYVAIPQRQIINFCSSAKTESLLT
jgi:hypothetical protein